MKHPIKTGWPPGLLQDDSRDLSRWLATRPGSRLLAEEAATDAEADEYQREQIETARSLAQWRGRTYD